MSVLLVSSQKSDGVNTAAEKLKNELSSSFKCTISTLQMDTLFAGYKFEKLNTGETEYIEHFQIILHKVRGPVTCWEVVVHHSRPVYSMMDGMLVQTH